MENETFKITDNHLKLLKRMIVDWDDCEFGAPCIDPKRPYGNSDVYQDMLEILGLKELKDGIYKFKLNDKKWLLKGTDKYNIYLDGADEEKLCDKLKKLHKEMETVLQICFLTQSFKIGEYEKKDEYDCLSWKIKK